MKGVIFDFDMTLIDSSHAMLQSFEKLHQRFGCPRVSREKLMSAVGFHDEAFWEATIGGMTDEMEAFYTTHCAPFEPLDFVAFDGAKELVKKLKALGLKLAVATNRADVGELMSRTGLAPYFDFVACSGMVAHPKPAPDMLHLALDALGLKADEVVYVGDTAIDLRAGKAAGLRTVALATSSAVDELKAHDPWHICQDYAQLEALLTA